MASLDQLPADRKAIIELVVRRGQSYEALAGLLGMPEARVREYAREALASLAPRTASRVDPGWRDQVADYVLRQQAGPQERATRSHLRSSEPARTWALSVLDTLGELYPAGAQPVVPDGDGAGAPANTGGEPRERRRRGRRAAAERPAQRERDDSPEDSARARAERRRERGAAASATDGGPGRRRPSVALGAVRRRRIVAGGAALAVAGLVALGIFVFGDGGEGDGAADQEQTTDEALPAGQPDVLARIPLEPVGGTTGTGGAIIANQGGRPFLIVQAKLPRSGRNEAYEVWLYNNEEDALSIGAQVTDQEGNFQGIGELPEDFGQYQFVDVSLEQQDGEAAHSGNSVLRAPIPEVDAGAAEEPEVDEP